MLHLTKDVLIIAPIPPIILTAIVIIVNVSSDKLDWPLLFTQMMLLCCLLINLNISLQIRRQIIGENLEISTLNNPTYNPINEIVKNDIIVNNENV